MASYATLRQGDFRGGRRMVFGAEREDRVAIIAGTSQRGSAEPGDGASERSDRFLEDGKTA